MEIKTHHLRYKSDDMYNLKQSLNPFTYKEKDIVLKFMRFQMIQEMKKPDYKPLVPKHWEESCLQLIS